MNTPVPMGSDVSEGGQITVRWRDDGRAWENERVFQLGDTGDRYPAAWRYRLGHYRTRQWEIVCASPIPAVIVFLEEEAEVLSE